jgi:alpha-tubulin suppressor-like RCC1 family protein
MQIYLARDSLLTFVNADSRASDILSGRTITCIIHVRRRLPNFGGKEGAMKIGRQVVMSAVAVAATIVYAGAAPSGATQVTDTASIAGGTLWSWGSNKWGDLGDGTIAGRPTPVMVKLPAGTTITSVAAGVAHTLALTSTGRVLGWGDNFQGELGNGSTKISHVPVPAKIPARDKIIQVGAGCYDSIALTAAGRVLTWGRNDFGELGNGTRTDSAVPVAVKLPARTKVTAVSAGCYFNMALTASGKVLTWGRNDVGQLGDGNMASSRVPVHVRFRAAVKIASIWAGIDTGMAVATSGRVYTWQGLPVVMPLPSAAKVGAVTAMASGRDFVMALTTRGIVLAWGQNESGQLGDGTSRSSESAVKVHLPPGVRASAISATIRTGYAVTTNGLVLAWGSSHNGALGNGATSDTDVPVTVSLTASPAIAVSAGGIQDGSDGPHVFVTIR